MVNYKENLRKTYNKIAKDWNQDHLNDDWWNVGVNKFIKLVGWEKLVLDVGCGTGLKSKLMISKGLNVTGLDISEKMIEIAKREVPQGEFFVGDMENIKLNQKFDGIFVHACLLHSKKNKAARVIKNWVKLLNHHGYLYIAVKETRGIDEEVVKEDDYGYEYERFFSYYNKEEVEKYLKNAGLEIVHSVVVPAGKTNWVQVIGKKA